MLALVTIACGQTSTTPADEDEDREPLWEAFTVAAMKADRERQDVEFLTVLDERQFRLGILNVPRGPDSGLIVNRLSAVYLVVAGSGRIATDSVDIEVGEGHMVFVRGDAEHRIHQVQEELDIVVILRVASPNVADPEIAAFTPEEMAEGVDPEAATFNLLSNYETLGLAMYMVPKGTGADLPMIHRMDELKLILGGFGRLDIGTQGIAAEEGAIAFIPDGVQHQFRRVADALKVLVVWER